jgi:hypothetical protein
MIDHLLGITNASGKAGIIFFKTFLIDLIRQIFVFPQKKMFWLQKSLCLCFSSCGKFATNRFCRDVDGRLILKIENLADVVTKLPVIFRAIPQFPPRFLISFSQTISKIVRAEPTFSAWPKF